MELQTPVMPDLELSVDQGEVLQPPTWTAQLVERSTRVVAQMDIDRLPSRIVVVSGPGHREGRSTTAVALAVATAKTRGEPVLLVDLDLRSRALGGMLGVKAGAGVLDTIRNPSKSLRLVAAAYTDLAVVTAGRGPAEPAALVYRRACDWMLPGLREHYPWIFVDMPPVLSDPTASFIAEAADFLLLVGRHRRTTTESLREASDILSTRRRPDGFVMTAATSRLLSWMEGWL